MLHSNVTKVCLTLANNLLRSCIEHTGFSLEYMFYKCIQNKIQERIQRRRYKILQVTLPRLESHIRVWVHQGEINYVHTLQ